MPKISNIAKKQQSQKKAKKAYQNLSDAGKKLVGYFCNSLRVNGYVIPDGLYFNKNPKMFIENMREAEKLLRSVSLMSLYSTIDICHKRRHPFWGKVPLFKISTLRKAYNGLLSTGDIRPDVEESIYGKNEEVF